MLSMGKMLFTKQNNQYGNDEITVNMSSQYHVSAGLAHTCVLLSLMFSGTFFIQQSLLIALLHIQLITRCYQFSGIHWFLSTAQMQDTIFHLTNFRHPSQSIPPTLLPSSHCTWYLSYAAVGLHQSTHSLRKSGTHLFYFIYQTISSPLGTQGQCHLFSKQGNGLHSKGY